MPLPSDPAPHFTTMPVPYTSQISQSSEECLPLAFSGWIHVAVTSNQEEKKKFKRRYCKLRDLRCTFYDKVGGKAKKHNKHLIKSVSRLNEVNQGILVIDHKDRHLNLYTEFASNFQMWYSAFEEALLTRDSSSRSRTGSSKSRGSTNSNSPPQSLKALSINSNSDSSLLSDTPRAIWVQMETTVLFVKKMKRRYFVLTGEHLTYFDVNIEGREAEGSGFVTNVQRYDKIEDGLEIELNGNTKIRIQIKRSPETKEWYRAVCEAARGNAKRSD